MGAEVAPEKAGSATCLVQRGEDICTVYPASFVPIPEEWFKKICLEHDDDTSNLALAWFWPAKSIGYAYLQ
jgi:hypothetical protein